MFFEHHPITAGQANALELGTNILVSGPAGTGKTYLAMLYARKYKQEAPGCKVMIIVFTNALKKFISEALKSWGLEDVKVSNSTEWKHSLLFRDADIDYCIVDEVQDMVLSELELIRLHSRMGLVFLGDENQSIYFFKDRMGIGSFDNIVSKFGLCHVRLNEVVRYNEGLSSFLNDIILVDDVLIRNGGNKPEIKCFETNLDLYLQLKYEMENVVLGETNAFICYRNEEIRNLVIGLQSVGEYDFGYKYSTNEGNVDTIDFAQFSTNIMTIHSAKGLEFDNVYFVCQEHAGMISEKAENHYYSAFSRAKKYLKLYYVNYFLSNLKISKEKYIGEIKKLPHQFLDEKLKVALVESRIEMLKEMVSSNLDKEEIYISLKLETISTLNELREALEKLEMTPDQVEQWISDRLHGVDLGLLG